MGFESLNYADNRELRMAGIRSELNKKRQASTKAEAGSAQNHAPAESVASDFEQSRPESTHDSSAPATETDEAKKSRLIEEIFSHGQRIKADNPAAFDQASKSRPKTEQATVDDSQSANSYYGQPPIDKPDSPQEAPKIRSIEELVPIFYKRLIRIYHPDRAGQDPESQAKAKRITQELNDLRKDRQKFINYALKLCKQDGIDLFQLLNQG